MIIGKKVAIFDWEWGVDWEWGRNLAPRDGQKSPVFYNCKHSLLSVFNKMLVIRAGTDRKANRENPDQTASSEAV